MCSGWARTSPSPRRCCDRRRAARVDLDGLVDMAIVFLVAMLVQWELAFDEMVTDAGSPRAGACRQGAVSNLDRGAPSPARSGSLGPSTARRHGSAPRWWHRPVVGVGLRLHTVRRRRLLRRGPQRGVDDGQLLLRRRHLVSPTGCPVRRHGPGRRGCQAERHCHRARTAPGAGSHSGGRPPAQ